MESRSMAWLQAGSQRRPRRTTKKSRVSIHRSAALARRRKWLPRFVFLLRPKLPTLLDKSWWLMEATSFRRTRAVEATVLSSQSDALLGDLSDATEYSYTVD